ncbi:MULTISPECIES: adenosylmethionine--8-amino-7-oxononanoate transaminase [Microvirga]|uniref:Adenosylmethionine-8-amino-7-oxononanoate aminotransferase n=1 Tax=Microvirga lotononidis TaxID=864069 RepID=I4Z3G1_9HYPH|nr:MULTISPECIES: adenosylmethionine--8-amino-7-oxononanoate transaminase [Microvirga]EIM30753.1 adenosylmethionine-8-amino-7-oxononanoate aminotransferase [Microvirga lotononidis]WQO30054.1 adenosylmethionine--8-amino-7-oxononanoate transaminase [Microvirga lotononidis]
MLRPQPSPVWRPFTQHLLDPVAKRIARTEGAYLIDEDGRAIFDAISSWWVITHGHRHPAIMDAIRVACERFDQIIFAEYTHEPAEELAKGLIRLAPPGLAHVFFSDSGSTSVEVALKMALGFFYNRGAPRSRIVVMEHSYHGDTVGTMSTGARGVFNAAYGPLLFNVDTIPFPEPGREQDTLDAFEQFCRGGQIAALLVEPLVLGAGGMRMYPPHLLTELKRIAEQHQTLLIADEVMTGWGRTGTLFACEQAGITPDILCTSKGMTGGAVPLAATLCSTEIFDAHLSHDRSRMFFHSSSYTANPIACAAALANLGVWQDEPVATRIGALARMHRERLAQFRSDPRFVNVRQAGTIAAFDLDVAASGYLSEVGPRLRAFFRQRDLLIRPLGNVIYLMPPYCVTADDLDRVYAAIDEAASTIVRVRP